MLQYSRTPCRYQVSLQVSIFSSCDIYTTSSKLMYLLWLQNIPIHPNTLSTPFTFKIPDCDESKIVRKKVSNYIFMAGWILHASLTACTLTLLQYLLYIIFGFHKFFKFCKSLSKKQL